MNIHLIPYLLSSNSSKKASCTNISFSHCYVAHLRQMRRKIMSIFCDTARIQRFIYLSIFHIGCPFIYISLSSLSAIIILFVIMIIPGKKRNSHMSEWKKRKKNSVSEIYLYIYIFYFLLTGLIN